MPWKPIDEAVAAGHGTTESWLEDHERGRAPTKLDPAGALLVWVEDRPHKPRGAARWLRRISELQRELGELRRAREREGARHARELRALKARLGVLRAAADDARARKPSRRAARQS